MFLSLTVFCCFQRVPLCLPVTIQSQQWRAAHSSILGLSSVLWPITGYQLKSETLKVNYSEHLVDHKSMKTVRFPLGGEKRATAFIRILSNLLFVYDLAQW